MKMLKAITTDGETVYFAVSQILTITPKQNGSTTILMGAGLYWRVKTETVTIEDLGYKELETLVKEG